MSMPQPNQTIIVPDGTGFIYRPSQTLGMECCYCWKFDNQQSEKFHLHEIIFSRGSVMNAGHEALMAIMDRRNCGLVHAECHPYAEGGPGRLKGIAYLIRYEGYQSVMSFIKDTMSNFVDVSNYARDLVQVYGKMRDILGDQWDKYGQEADRSK